MKICVPWCGFKLFKKDTPKGVRTFYVVGMETTLGTMLECRKTRDGGRGLSMCQNNGMCNVSTSVWIPSEMEVGSLMRDGWCVMNSTDCNASRHVFISVLTEFRRLYRKGCSRSFHF